MTSRTAKTISRGSRTKRSNRAAQPESYSSWDLSTAARRISEGLLPNALEMIQSALGLTNQEMAHVLLIAPRTLSRRRKEDRLPPDESERIYRVACLLEVASSTLGGAEAARSWMKEPNHALGNVTPLEYARTGPGVELVERVLRQIDHGIAA